MSHGSLRNSLRETAAEWHQRLHGDKSSAEERQEFARWLAASPEHASAYHSIETVWSALQQNAHHPEILALRQEAALGVTRRTSQNVRRWAAVAAVFSIVFTVVVAPALQDRTLLNWVSSVMHPDGNGVYDTATGERLTATLDDGSQVTLDTQTELRVSFGKEERTVQLTRGQALFEVAKDPRRPFVVEAHHRRLVALGTAFDVRIDGDQVRVTMLEGTVRVERKTQRSRSREGSAAREKRAYTPKLGAAINAQPALAENAEVVATLSAGDELTVSRGGDDRVRQVDPGRNTSWRNGQVIFDSARLADVVAELNRYYDTKIELGDPSLADLRLSGAFTTSRSSVFVEAIGAYFPITVERASGGTVVLTRRRP